MYQSNRSLNDRQNIHRNKDYDVALYYFYQGKSCEAHKLFGVHKCIKDEIEGFVFRVWAPNAKAVSVVGEFNSWDSSVNTMKLG